MATSDNIPLTNQTSDPPNVQDSNVQEDSKGEVQEADDPPIQCSCKCCLDTFIHPGFTMIIIYSVSVGFGVGVLMSQYTIPKIVNQLISYPGQLWVSALQMVVIPLIACGMIHAVIDLGDIAKIKNIGKRALLYYVSTTFLSVIEGFIWVYIFEPGKINSDKAGSEVDSAAEQDAQCAVSLPEMYNINGTVQKAECYGILPSKSTIDSILDIGLTMLPKNIFVAASEPNILGLIVFACLFGYFCAKEPKCAVLLDFFEVANNALMNIVIIIIWFTPPCVCSLIINAFLGITDLTGTLHQIALLVAATLTGIFFHMCFVYPLIYFICTRRNPYKILVKMVNPMLVAFSTSSSAATLPVTMKTAENVGAHKEIARFMLPLGATINMDGTGIYFPIAINFIANLDQTPLDFGKRIMVSLVSAFVSAGAAPIPSAGLVYIILILNSVNLKQTSTMVLVFTVDWLLDRAQTACNVTGDGFGAQILEHFRKQDIKNSSPEQKLFKRRRSQITYTNTDTPPASP